MDQLVDANVKQAIDSSKIASREQIKYIKSKFADVELPFTEVCTFYHIILGEFCMENKNCYYLIAHIICIMLSCRILKIFARPRMWCVCLSFHSCAWVL